MSHNPLAIDKDTPPDWINPEGVKWWRLNNDLPDKDGVPFLTEKPDGEKMYVIIRAEGLVYETGNLEFLFSKLQEYHLRRTIK